MREVGLPHDLVNADVVAGLDAVPFEPYRYVQLPFEQFAGPGQYAFGPQMAALPFMITRFQHIAEPSEAGFGAYPVEARIAVKDARENEVGQKLREHRERR